MTNEERKEALLKLEHTYDRLCAQAKDLVYQMSREPAASARNQLREKLISIDQQRTNLYAEMDALWKSE
jgi:ABC-type molybdate transport system ATPase subunit